MARLPVNETRSAQTVLSLSTEAARSSFPSSESWQSTVPGADRYGCNCGNDTRLGSGVWSNWWLVPLSAVGGVALMWLALVVALWFSKPDANCLRDAMRLLPDIVRLLKRLAVDPEMPRGIRIRLVLLLAYLASPIDLIPDFIPVSGTRTTP